MEEKSAAFIPVVDLSQETQVIVEAVRAACSGPGFMYLKNTGMCPREIHTMFQQSAAFFALPEQEKRLYAWGSTGYPNTGYVAMLQEALDPASGSRDPKEAFNVTAPAWCGLQGRNSPSQSVLPPQEMLPELQPTLCSFFQRCQELTERLLRYFALALGLPEDHLIPLHRIDEPTGTTLRLLHYPPVPLPDGEEESLNSIRAGEHSDYGSLTLLFQDDIGGLQVFHKESEEFVDAIPIPDTVVVNTGDLMQHWSGGRFTSTVHRVCSRGQGRRHRYSIAFFSHPNDSVPLLPLVEEDTKGLSGQPEEDQSSVTVLTAGEYLSQKLSASY